MKYIIVILLTIAGYIVFGLILHGMKPQNYICEQLYQKCYGWFVDGDPKEYSGVNHGCETFDITQESVPLKLRLFAKNNIGNIVELWKPHSSDYNWIDSNTKVGSKCTFRFSVQTIWNGYKKCYVLQIIDVVAR